MAEPARPQLNGWNSPGRHFFRIHGGINIGFNDADSYGAFQAFNRPKDEAGLARSRRGHQIQKQRFGTAEPLPNPSGDLVIVGQDFFFNLNESDILHHCTSIFPYFNFA
jgi:hypothetical protein